MELAGGGWRQASEMGGSGTLGGWGGQSRKPVPQPQTWYSAVSMPVSSVGAAGTCLGKASVLLPPSFGVVRCHWNLACHLAEESYIRAMLKLRGTAMGPWHGMAEGILWLRVEGAHLVGTGSHKD